MTIPTTFLKAIAKTPRKDFDALGRDLLLYGTAAVTAEGRRVHPLTVPPAGTIVARVKGWEVLGG